MDKLIRWQKSVRFWLVKSSVAFRLAEVRLSLPNRLGLKASGPANKANAAELASTAIIENVEPVQVLERWSVVAKSCQSANLRGVG